MIFLDNWEEKCILYMAVCIVFGNFDKAGCLAEVSLQLTEIENKESINKKGPWPSIIEPS